MTSFAIQAKRRTIFVMALLFIMALALFARLLDLQILRHDFLVAEAAERIWVEIPLRARRGRIYDRSGQPLALNEKGYVLWVDAGRLEGPPAALALLARLSDWRDKALVNQVISKQRSGFYHWARWVDPQYLEPLLEWIDKPDNGLKGVTLEVEPRRSYPYKELLAPVLGYLQDSGQPDARQVTEYNAYGGVEAYYDDVLRGVDGWMRMEQDKQYYMIPIGRSEKHPPRDGAHLTLTLDLNIQYMAERILAEAVNKSEVRRGDIIVMDPQTGAILAFVSLPSFDPGRVTQCANDPNCEEMLYTNPVIGRHYEPGSTFKILTMAIALEEHVVRPDSAFECTGLAVVGDQYFHNWNSQAHGYETMNEILLHSCNVGAVYLSQRIGPDAYYRYLDRLGFGRPTGLDMAGEASGDLRTPDSDYWALSDLAANSFGQAINVTPIQLVTAVAAVANGGELVRPYIVQAIESNGVVTETLPTVRGRVFHSEVCRDVSEMLADIGDIKSLEGGAIAPGYRVAAKTGTAQIPIPGQGYDPYRTIASVIGYAPAEDPRFLMLVRLEGETEVWGDQVAMPIFRELTQFLLGYLRVPPSAGERPAD
ncbi:MAG: penicillin-binding protein 2 [Chloroflexia bacterium]|nr:penicillin-binding protein 2 [Chloroflexia bacterium]